MTADDDTGRGPPRRAFLRGSGALALTGAVAGCVDALPPLGRRVALGNVEPPDAGPPAYQPWIPSPSAVSDASFSAHDVLQVTPTSIEYVDGEQLATFPRAVVESSVDWFASGYEAYDRVIRVGSSYTLLGNIEPATVADALEPTGYEGAGSYEEYTLYSRTDVPRTVAVKPGVVLYATDPLAERPIDDDSEPLVKAVADAGADRIERHHESDADFARLTEAVGDRPAAWIGPAAFDPTDEVVAGAVSEAVDDQEAYQLLHLLYPEGVDPAIREIERAIEADARALVSDRSEVSAEGRLAVVEGLREVTPVDEFGGHEWPQVTWGVEHDGDTATIRHEAGQRVDAAKLALLVIDDTGAKHPTDQQFVDRFESVGPSDERSVALDDSAVQLVLEYRQNEHRKGRLLSYRVP